MTPAAWLGALAIGLTLGLLGAGGSILTVPVLVYLVGEAPKLAVAESLAIVGAIAAAGALPHARKGLVAWSTVLLFSLPGMMGSYVGAVGAKFVTGRAQLATFSVLMLVAGVLMMRPPKWQETPRTRLWIASVLSRYVGTRVQAFADGLLIGTEGFLIGIITGFLGVGGGFLIVPALVLMVGLPIHLAVGTSLATIALNSAVGFYKSAQILSSLNLRLNLGVIATFIVIGVTGSLIGGAICHRLPQRQLRRLFAWFVLAMGLYLLWRNLSGLHA
jgi:uncharacterized protein